MYICIHMFYVCIEMKSTSGNHGSNPVTVGTTTHSMGASDKQGAFVQAIEIGARHTDCAECMLQHRVRPVNVHKAGLPLNSLVLC